MIYLFLIVWFGTGLIGAKWILDCSYRDSKKIDNSDVGISIYTLLMGPMGLFVGWLNKYADKLDVLDRPLTLTQMIDSYYRHRRNNAEK